MRGGHRSGSSSEIVQWDVDRSTLLYTDGLGLLIFDCLLSELNIIFPFHSFIVDVLNLLNTCPIQLGANAWRILRAFEVKCQNEDVEPTAPLFFFFQFEWPNRGFLSLSRWTNRPQVLSKCPSHPKNWEERYIQILGSPNVRP